MVTSERVGILYFVRLCPARYYLRYFYVYALQRFMCLCVKHTALKHVGHDCMCSLYAKEKGKGSRPKKEYAEAPQVGTMVATSMGKGKVTTVNKAKHTATVQLSRDNVVTLEWDELIDASQAMDDD